MERPKTSGPQMDEVAETRERGKRCRYSPPKLISLGSVADLTHGPRASTADSGVPGFQNP